MIEPVEPAIWNPHMAAHLLNRAGFGGTPEHAAALAELKPEEAVRALVRGTWPAGDNQDVPPPAWVEAPDTYARPGFRKNSGLSPEERQRQQQIFRRLQIERIESLQHWWLNRMRHAAHPLQEKMTLFWHGHFATSFEKVRHAGAMYAQNQMLRAHATGNLRDLLRAVARDPAMLVYLDNAQSRKSNPNENFAREFMELFTLGEGRYTEQDVREAARAFAGWSIEPDRMFFQRKARESDRGNKEFLGENGPFDGDDIIDIILRQPACAPFIVRKLWRFLAWDEPDEWLIEALAEQFRIDDYAIDSLLENILLSRAFYALDQAYAQIKSPVYWLVNSCIVLEGTLPDARACGQITRLLGQELFMPPNVKGWDGGPSWITAATLMQRYNTAGYLVKGAQGMKSAPARRKKKRSDDEAMMMNDDKPDGIEGMSAIADLDRILPRSRRKTMNDAYDYLEWRFFQRALSEREKHTIKLYLTKKPMTAIISDVELRNFLHVMMSTPHFQVC
jgi:uncharacterized protein (DUF1800 family)